MGGAGFVRVGVLFVAPLARAIMGFVSVALLVALSLVFLRGAWRALKAPRPTAAAPPRFDSRRAGFLLGAGMALTSPWNVAFWLAAIGRPEMSGYRLAELLTMAAAVLAGALSWGIIWASSVTLVGRRAAAGEFRPLVDFRRRSRHRRADGRLRRALGVAADKRLEHSCRLEELAILYPRTGGARQSRASCPPRWRRRVSGSTKGRQPRWSAR